jgi:hypothetical protein
MWGHKIHFVFSFPSTVVNGIFFFQNEVVVKGCSFSGQRYYQSDFAPAQNFASHYHQVNDDRISTLTLKHNGY